MKLRTESTLHNNFSDLGIRDLDNFDSFTKRIADFHSGIESAESAFSGIQSTHSNKKSSLPITERNHNRPSSKESCTWQQYHWQSILPDRQHSKWVPTNRQTDQPTYSHQAKFPDQQPSHTTKIRLVSIGIQPKRRRPEVVEPKRGVGVKPSWEI